LNFQEDFSVRNFSSGHSRSDIENGESKILKISNGGKVQESKFAK
jgi:hypothetical protein